MPQARKQSKQASRIFLSCAAGGVPALISEGVSLAAIEKETGLPVHELAQCVFSSSAGTIASAPLFVRDPENPSQALMTAEEALAASERNAALWLRNSWRPQDVQKILESHIGNAVMKDYFGSQIIPLHDNSAKVSDEQARLFYKIKTADGSFKYEPGKNTPVTSVIQASSAVPIKFRSVPIGEQKLCDFGHLHEGARGLAVYSREAGVPLDRIKYVEVGPPRFHAESNSLNWIEGLRMMFNETSNHSFSSSISMVRTLVGEENTHLLYAEHRKGKIRSNLLDPSNMHIRQIKTMTEEYLHGEGKDSLRRICDLMGDNHAIRQASRMEAVAPRPKGIFGGLFSGRSNADHPRAVGRGAIPAPA